LATLVLAGCQFSNETFEAKFTRVQELTAPVAGITGLEVSTDVGVLRLDAGEGGVAEFRSRRTTNANYRWSYDSTSGYLSLTFPKLPRDVVTMLRGAVGYELVSYDTLTRTAVQYVRDRQMSYTGYTLFPAATLYPEYYAIAQRVPPSQLTVVLNWQALLKK
jgi:hypothetical protein